jgi:hypothetical protein
VFSARSRRRHEQSVTGGGALKRLRDDHSEPSPSAARERCASTAAPRQVLPGPPRAPLEGASRSRIKAKVLEALTDGPMTASQIAKATGIGAGTVSTMLTEMAKTGELAKADPQVGQRCDDHLASAQRQFVRAHCTTCAADDVGVHGARHVCWTLLFARRSSGSRRLLLRSGRFFGSLRDARIPEKWSSVGASRNRPPPRAVARSDE